MCSSLGQRSVFAQSRNVSLFLFEELLIMESNRLSLFDQVKTFSFDSTMTQSSNQKSIDVRLELMFFGVFRTLSPCKNRSAFYQSNRMFSLLFQGRSSYRWINHQSLLVMTESSSRCSSCCPLQSGGKFFLDLTEFSFLHSGTLISIHRKMSLLHRTESFSFCS